MNDAVCVSMVTLFAVMETSRNGLGPKWSIDLAGAWMLHVITLYTHTNRHGERERAREQA